MITKLARQDNNNSIKIPTNFSVNRKYVSFSPLGKTTKEAVNKEDLDKELDQYMATTKTENDMDFLLKN